MRNCARPSPRPRTSRRPTGSSRNGRPMPRLSVQRLFDERRVRLGLAWAAAPEGGAREFTHEMVHKPGVGLIGHLNLIHALLAQVLGPRELDYVAKLEPAARAQTCAHIAAPDTVCVI